MWAWIRGQVKNFSEANHEVYIVCPQDQEKNHWIVTLIQHDFYVEHIPTYYSHLM